MTTTTLWIDGVNRSFVQQATYDDIATALAVFLLGLAYITKGKLWDKADPYRYKLFEKPQQRASAPRVEQHTDDLGKRLEVETSDIAILWASQSGTAERHAGRLAKELSRNFGAKVLPIDVSDVDPASLMNLSGGKIVIFIASTYGEGDPSDNLHRLWVWLQETKDNTLPHLRFLAFGLGNSKYKHYNHVVDILVSELLHRGAQMLLSPGKADDAAGETEEHFLEWKQKVFDLFHTKLNYQQQEIRYEPSIQITSHPFITPSDLWCGSPFIHKVLSTQSKGISMPIVRSYDLLRDSTDRKCLHFELDISHSSLKYKTGDHLAIWPINPAQEVLRLLRMLGLEDKKATPIHIMSVDESKVHVPSPTTLEAAFQAYLEICTPISRETIDSLLLYAPTEEARGFLKTISQDKISYAAYSKSTYLNLGRLLEAACPVPAAWNSVPLSFVIETLPATQPRYYSISSSSVVSPRQISITVAVSDTTSAGSEDRVIGLATNYLLSAKDGFHPRGLTYSQTLDNGHIYAAVRKSTFKLPIQSSAPIIMVGAGTGVAPFRAFVSERARLKSMGRAVGRTRLFFGCRDLSQDLVYADEFSRWANELDGCFSMTTAFSRPKDGRDKQYVQDAILEDGDAICEQLVEENAYFYICGSAAMARDVSTTISKIIMAAQNWSEGEMKDFADRQKRQKRWLQDVWG